MEKFLYLFRGGDMPESKRSPEAMQAHMQEWMTWMGGLMAKGNNVEGEPLHSTGMQVNGSGKMVIDGPFMEGKEMVGGYLLVDAKDMAEAVEISKGCPILEFDGKIEIRAISRTGM